MLHEWTLGDGELRDAVERGAEFLHDSPAAQSVELWADGCVYFVARSVAAARAHLHDSEMQATNA